MRRPVWSVVKVFLSLSALAACGAPKPIKIGFVGTLSGSASELGVSGRRGAELAVRVRNERGGIKGRPVELLIYDDKNDPEVAALLVGEMKKDGIAAVIGPMTSNVGIAIAEKANEAELPTLSPTVSFMGLFGKDDYFFIMVPSNVQDGQHLAELAHSRGLRNISIIGDMANRQYTTVYAEAFSRRFRELGGSASPLVPYDPKHRGRAQDMVAAAMASRPDGLLSITGAADTAVIVQEAAKLKPDMPVLTNPWSMTSDLIPGTGSFGKNLVIQSLYDPYDERPRFKEFASAYAGLFGTDPGFGAVFSYDAAAALFEALESTGDHRPRALKKALLSGTVESGCGDPFGFSATGESGKPLYAFTIGGGKFQRLE